jgi:hypothetical protein
VKAITWIKGGPLAVTKESNSEREPLIKKTILAILEKQFSPRGISFKALSESDFSAEQKDNLKETLTLWKALMKNECNGRMCGDYSLRNIEAQDFSLGPEVALLDPNADLFLVVHAIEVLPTDEFKHDRFERELGMNILMLPIMVLSMGRSGGYSEPRGISYFAMGLIDAKTGNAIWREYTLSKEVDLADEEESESMLFHIFNYFPVDQLKSN